MGHPNETWMIVSNYDDYTANRATDSQSTLDIMSATEVWSDATRGNCPDSEGAKCQLSATRAAYVETPMFVSMNMWDHHQLNTLGVDRDPTTWTEDHWTWLKYYARAMRASTIHWLNQSNAIGNGLFVPKTIAHGGDIGSRRNGATDDNGLFVPFGPLIHDHDYFEVLADWFYDWGNLTSHVFIDACDS